MTSIPNMSCCPFGGEPHTGSSSRESSPHLVSRPPTHFCPRSAHSELSEALCEEVMTRQLDCEDPSTQKPVLCSLVPWMKNLAMDPRAWQVWNEKWGDAPGSETG